jgi:hypothetical protein
MPLIHKNFQRFAPRVSLPKGLVFKFQPAFPWRKFSLCFFVLFFLSGCGHIQIFRDWNKTDTALMATSLGLTFIDYRQTLDIVNHIDDGYYEKYNSTILGKHPSRGRVNTWFLCSALTKTLIAGALPKSDKKGSWLDIFNRENWLVLNIGISSGLIYNNYEIGLEVNF